MYMYEGRDQAETHVELIYHKGQKCTHTKEHSDRHTHSLWGSLNSVIPLSDFSTGPHNSSKFIQHTHSCLQFSLFNHREPVLSFQQVASCEDPHTMIQVTPAFHFTEWSASNGTDGWTLDTQTDSKGYLPKQQQRGQRGEEERTKTSKVALRSNLLHVLEGLTLDFFAFYSYVTHTRLRPHQQPGMPR